MAAILISAELNERTIKKGFDDLSKQAELLRKRFADVFGGGDFQQAVRKLNQVKDAAARTEAKTLQLAQAQARLLTISGDLAGAQRKLEGALQGVEKESLASLRAQTQLVQVQKRLGDGLEETGRKGRVASEIIREGFSEVLEELIKDGSVANELTKAFFAMPTSAKVALGAIATGAIAAGVAIAALVAGTKQMLDVAEKVGTKSRDEFNEFAKAVRSAGGTVTTLDRGLSQELLRSVEQVKGAFDNVFLVMLRQSGPEMIILLRQVAKLLIQLAPLASQVGYAFSLAFSIANAALTTLVNNAGKAAKALTTLFAPRLPTTNVAAIAQRVADDINAVKDLASIKTDFDVNLKKAIEDAQKLRGDGFKVDPFKDKSGAAAARQDRAARLAEARSALQDELRLYREFAKEQLDTLKEAYDAGFISTREYFSNRVLLADAEVAKIIEITNREAEAIKSIAEQVKKGTPEEIKLRKELNETYAKGALELQKLTGEVIKNGIEFKKAFALPKDLIATEELTGGTQRERRLGTFGPLTGPIEDAAEKRVAAIEAAKEFARIQESLHLQRVQIQNQVITGNLTELEGRRAILAVEREARDLLIQQLEIQKAGTGDLLEIAKLQTQIEQLKALGVELDNGQRFARGFGSEIESVGDIFERFGSNVARALTNVKDLFSSLKAAVLGFFRDILGNALQNLVRGTLGGLFGGGGGGAAGGGGGGIGSILGSVFGGGGGGFRTPGINPGGGGLGAITNFLSGGGFTAPSSLSGGLPILPNIAIPSLSAIHGIPGTGTGAVTRGLGGGLGALFSGIGFGRAPGSGGALAGLLPLLGLSLGSSLGGSSRLGSILGGAGGLLAGIGLTAAPGIIGAGGALSGLGFLTPLFSNPITAIAGAVALVGAILLGKAAARRRDEKTSGESLQRAIDAIKALRKAADSNQLTSVADAESSFKEIHSQFIEETKQLKTASVRRSRLENQGDITPPLHKDSLRLLFEREVLPRVIAARTRAQTFAQLVPEFATGGFHRGVGYALLHDGEAILNLQQQSRLRALTSPNILQVIGVPNAQPPTPAPSFASGGIYAGATSPQIHIHVDGMRLEIGPGDATGIVGLSYKTDDGQRNLYGTIQDGRRNNKL